MKRNFKKHFMFISALFISMGVAQAATKSLETPTPATGIITYTVTFNNDSNDAYVLAYPVLGKAFSSNAIKCCESTAADPTKCLNDGPWFKGSVSAHKSITLICPANQPASAKTLKSFAPSKFFSLVKCSVSSDAKGNNQINSSSCHVF